jgi:hypothetical protein
VTPSLVVFTAVASALAVADAVTTALRQRRGDVEENPLLGGHPSDVELALWLLVGLGVFWSACFLVPTPYAWGLAGGVLGIEGCEFWHNLDALRR